MPCKLNVAVLTSSQNCMPRLQACRDTWFKDVKGDLMELDDFDEVDVTLGKDSTSRKYERYIGFTVFDPFAWYMLCDDDTYVCYDKLCDWLEKEQSLSVATVCGAYVQGRYGTPVQRKLNPKVMCHNGGAGICFNGAAAIMLKGFMYGRATPIVSHMHACDQWLAASFAKLNSEAAMWHGRSYVHVLRGNGDKFLTSKPGHSVEKAIEALRAQAHTVSHVTPDDIRSIHEAMPFIRDVGNRECQGSGSSSIPGPTSGPGEGT